MHLLIDICMAQFKISHNEVDQEQAEEISRNFVVFIKFSRQSLHGPNFYFLSFTWTTTLPFTCFSLLLFLSISININSFMYVTGGFGLVVKYKVGLVMLLLWCSVKKMFYAMLEGISKWRKKIIHVVGHRFVYAI